MEDPTHLFEQFANDSAYIIGGLSYEPTKIINLT